jgi:hypothetical protein
MSVTFLNPVVALVAGALYLGEAVSLQTLVGAAVVLAGTALSLGLWPGRVEKAVPAAVVVDTAVPMAPELAPEGAPERAPDLAPPGEAWGRP